MMLYDNLTAFGYECVKPDGAFYLFVKSPVEGDAYAFYEKAKEKEKNKANKKASKSESAEDSE